MSKYLACKSINFFVLLQVNCKESLAQPGYSYRGSHSLSLFVVCSVSGVPPVPSHNTSIGSPHTPLFGSYQVGSRYLNYYT